jgi:hypothetical protein
MNNQRARSIKSKVLESYGEMDDKMKETVLKSKKFKAIYRAAKKNFHLNKSMQNPNLKQSRRQLRLNKIV